MSTYVLLTDDKFSSDYLMISTLGHICEAEEDQEINELPAGLDFFHSSYPGFEYRANHAYKLIILNRSRVLLTLVA